MSNYRTIGMTLLAAGIFLAAITVLDYYIFVTNNSGALHVNSYEYIQYFAIAILVVVGLILIRSKHFLNKNSGNQ